MKNILAIVFAITFACIISSCTQTTGMSKRQTGALVGGGAGAAAGYALGGGAIGIIGGTVIGALLGSSIGHYMDKQDAQRALAASINQPVNRTKTWTSNGHTYSVTPQKEYVQGSTYCRQAKIMVDGKHVGYQTVCRGKDGKWYIK